MNRTLPLFEGLEGAPPAPEPAPAAAPTAAAGGDRHLRAAWRLSRSMWRYPDQSPQQTRAGLAICRHLQALLAQAQQPGTPAARE